MISPLIALMNDQVGALGARGIAAAALHSQCDDERARRRRSARPRRARAALRVAGARGARFFKRLLGAQPDRDVRDRRGALREPVGPRLPARVHAARRAARGRAGRTGDRADRDGDPARDGRDRELARAARAGDRARRLSPAEPRVRGPGARRAMPRGSRRRSRRSTAQGLRARTGAGRGIVYCSTRQKAETVAAALKDAGFAAGHYHAGRTLLLLLLLVQGLRSTRISVLGTMREAESRRVPDVGALISKLAREGELMALHRLQPTDVAAWMHSAFPEATPERNRAGAPLQRRLAAVHSRAAALGSRRRLVCLPARRSGFPSR